MQCVQTSFEWIQDIIFQYKSLYVRNLKSSLTISQIKKRGHMHVNNKDLAEVSFCIHFYRFLLICEKKNCHKMLNIGNWDMQNRAYDKSMLVKVMTSSWNVFNHKCIPPPARDCVDFKQILYSKYNKEAVQCPLLCVVLYVLQWMVLGIWNHPQNMFMNFVIMQRSTYRLHIVRRALTA